MALTILIDKIASAIYKGEYIMDLFYFAKAVDKVNHN